MREIICCAQLAEQHHRRRHLGLAEIAQHGHVDHQRQEHPPVDRPVIGRPHRRGIDPRQEEQQQDRAEHRHHAPELRGNPQEVERERLQDRVERQEIPFGHDMRRRGERVGRDVIVRVAEQVRREEHQQREYREEDAEAEAILGGCSRDGTGRCPAAPARRRRSGLFEPGMCSAQMCSTITPAITNGSR